jgi:hypothetical protein
MSKDGIPKRSLEPIPFEPGTFVKTPALDLKRFQR